MRFYPDGKGNAIPLTDDLLPSARADMTPSQGEAFDAGSENAPNLQRLLVFGVMPDCVALATTLAIMPRRAGICT